MAAPVAPVAPAPVAAAAAAPSADDQNSKALLSELFKSKYRFVKVIGKGSFGEAVLARCKIDNKRYVVKTIESATMSPKEKNDIQKEISILSGLNHPNIVRFKEHFEEGTLIFISMEYADGGDLNQRIKERKKTVPEGQTPEPFDPKLVMFWFLQIAMALKYLHDKHILHRDLKTANIFLTTKNVVKLGDFGISTVLQNTVACAKTVCGTPYYFSPELCQSKPYNNKSDVWALGVMFYETLTLNRPFNAKNLRELLKKVVAGQYDPVAESVPIEIRQLSAALLNLNPTLRPSINRVLEMPFIQAQLKVFSEEMQRQTIRDREEYEKKKAAQPAAAAVAVAPAVPVAPAVAPAGKLPADLRGLGAKDLRAMMAQQAPQIQAELAAQMERRTSSGAAGPGAARETDEATAEDDGDLLAQKERLVVGTRATVLANPAARLGGHDDEFGDAPVDSSQVEMITLASGRAVPAPEARPALEAELGPALLNSALNFVNELVAQPNAPSNQQIQRELNSLLGAKLSAHSGAITRLAIWESKQI
jgi:tRNA A-37 threonylcarbamoyl transferase component Bud32